MLINGIPDIPLLSIGSHDNVIFVSSIKVAWKFLTGIGRSIQPDRRKKHINPWLWRKVDFNLKENIWITDIKYQFTIFQTSHDISNVREAIIKHRVAGMHLCSLTKSLTFNWNTSSKTARQMISSSRSTLCDLKKYNNSWYNWMGIF